MVEDTNKLAAALIELAQASRKEGASLKALGGSESNLWNRQILTQTWDAAPVRTPGDETAVQKQLVATVSALSGLDPRDQLEGMLGAELVTVHNHALECFRRAADPRLSPELRQDNLNMANKLARTATMLVETLDKHRGKGQQKVTVEHVHVHPGGQAVVGSVELPPRRLGIPSKCGAANKPSRTHKTGGVRKEEGPPHAKRLKTAAHASEPALWSQDPEREPVPRSGDGERALPHARRKVTRRTEGK